MYFDNSHQSWYEDFGFEVYQPEHPPSPIYNPESPYFSGIHLDNSTGHRRDTGKFPVNILDREEFPDLAASNKALDDINSFIVPGKKGRKRKSNKAKAEFEFDKTAKPINISNFHQFVYNEPLAAEITEEKVDIKIESEVQDPLEAEELVIRSLCVAQNHAPIDSGELALSQNFPSHINSEYIRSLGKDEDDYDMTKELVRNVYIANPNRQIFYERRLLQSLQFRNVSDPSYIKAHFPMNEEFFQIDVRYMFNEDANSLNFIGNKLQTFVESRHLIKNVFYGKDWKTKFSEVMSWKKYRTQQAVLICSYALFFERNIFKRKRDIELQQLDSIFKNSIFKFSTLNSVFRYLGIVFMTDMCPFSHYKDRIINHLEYSHLDTLKKVKKEQRQVKRRKQELDDLDVEPWFLSDTESTVNSDQSI